MLAIPFSIYFRYAGNDLATFFTACLSIVPLAGLMGEATESLACHTGERIGDSSTPLLAMLPSC